MSTRKGIPVQLCTNFSRARFHFNFFAPPSQEILTNLGGHLLPINPPKMIEPHSKGETVISFQNHLSLHKPFVPRRPVRDLRITCLDGSMVVNRALFCNASKEIMTLIDFRAPVLQIRLRKF